MNRSLSLAALVLTAAASSACSIHNRTRTALEHLPAGSGRSVCVLLFDGLSQEAFSSLLAQGALPALQREIMSRGLVVDTVVASVPSETYPNLAAILTGDFPGHHGIPANIWLDRRLRRRESHTNIFRSYSASDFLSSEAHTLYERLPEATVAISTPIFKGATVTNKNLVSLTASYLRNDWVFFDRKTLDDVGDAYAGGAAAGRLPSLVLGHLVGPDEVAHSDGPASAEFKTTMSTIDSAFERLVRRLKRRKIYDNILFVLVADHGNSSYRSSVNADELVSQALSSSPTEADCAAGDCARAAERGTPRPPFDVGDAEIAVGAYRGVMIWLPATRPEDELQKAFTTRKARKPPKTQLAAPHRPMPPRSDLATALARIPEVRLVVTRGDEAGRVELYAGGGRAEIERQDTENGVSIYGYRARGEDPLGYSSSLPADFLAEPFHPADEWLVTTAHTDYPDLVVQLSEFFDSPRAPDIFITLCDDYGFRAGKVAGHGSLARSETVVPLVFAGPGVSPGHRAVARTIDIAPTLLKYLGIPFDPAEMDGDDLAITSAPPDVPPPPRPSPGDDEGDE